MKRKSNMQSKQQLLSLVLLGAIAASSAFAQSQGIPPEITTPDKVETRFGTLEFKDGAPSAATVEKIYDNLDFTHALNVFLNAYQGASTYMAREGNRSIGAADGDIVIFSELMDSQSLFLTANCDTIYALTILDLKKGPMVVEVPPGALGAVDGMWFHWVIDMGLPGPGSRRGREVFDLAARLPGHRTRERLSRSAVADLWGPGLHPLLPGEQRPQAGRGADQDVFQSLPLCAGWLRHECRHHPRRQGAIVRANASPRATADKIRRG
jgi:Protein of unknown function (DUF1254)